MINQNDMLDLKFGNVDLDVKQLFLAFQDFTLRIYRGATSKPVVDVHQA